VEFQASLFDMAPDKIRERLKDADLDQMTPMAALAFVVELKRLL
jgi:hypothetical protein